MSHSWLIEGGNVGTWGEEPWDNDVAADWFGNLWEAVPIVENVLAGLNDENGDVAVAALWMCTQLCRVYVWPIDRMDETLSAAVAAADRILAGEDENGWVELWGNAAMTARIEGYRTELIERLPEELR
jgi:hypothetical protein